MRLKDRRGFTLVEIILTIVIAAIVVSGLSAAVIQGTRGAVHAEIGTVASFLAQETMEAQTAKRRASGYAALSLGTTTESPVPGYADHDRSTEVCYWDAVAQAKTSPCDNGGTDTGYKIVTVTVQYTGALPYTVPDTVYETLVANY